MTKRSASTDNTALEAVFERLVGLIDHTAPAEQHLHGQLNQLKRRLLGEEIKKKPVKEFTFDDVIAMFKLKYSQRLGPSLTSLPESGWAIEDSISSPFVITPCLRNHISPSYCVL